jgi:hypothetical protein
MGSVSVDARHRALVRHRQESAPAIVRLLYGLPLETLL